MIPLIILSFCFVFHKEQDKCSAECMSALLYMSEDLITSYQTLDFDRTRTTDKYHSINCLGYKQRLIDFYILNIYISQSYCIVPLVYCVYGFIRLTAVQISYTRTD